MIMKMTYFLARVACWTQNLEIKLNIRFKLNNFKLLKNGKSPVFGIIY